jgi:hypothetical protein
MVIHQYSVDIFPSIHRFTFSFHFLLLYTFNFLYTGKLRKQVQINKEYSKMKYQPVNEARPTGREMRKRI